MWHKGLKGIDGVHAQHPRCQDIQRHGVVICAGDQLSASLFDKVAASRRDDVDLLDNLGRYGKEQLGIFHEKVAGTRMTINEHWGTPNSRALWSLWKMNSLLGRKAITAGWKSKTLPPFRPAYELMIDLVLPASILDSFRLFCPCDTLEDWVDSLLDWQSVRDVAAKVHQQLCSARRVSKLRRQPATKRDPILENISLFNGDALTLLALRAAVKRGTLVACYVSALIGWLCSAAPDTCPNMPMRFGSRLALARAPQVSQTNRRSFCWFPLGPAQDLTSMATERNDVQDYHFSCPVLSRYPSTSSSPSSPINIVLHGRLIVPSARPSKHPD
ncbi:hypothetical protein B0H10DRAFT_1958945 [Mycena sp. CBHHK59/15]|nr:hypothetical protein B0H10DRAFT_1958945 [Mycena sp. CBHHK59/15]